MCSTVAREHYRLCFAISFYRLFNVRENDRLDELDRWLLLIAIVVDLYICVESVFINLDRSESDWFFLSFQNFNQRNSLLNLPERGDFRQRSLSICLISISYSFFYLNSLKVSLSWWTTTEQTMSPIRRRWRPKKNALALVQRAEHDWRRVESAGLRGGIVPAPARVQRRRCHALARA